MYIMLTKCEFGWTTEEMQRAREDWKAGVPIEETAAILGRPALEVFLLIVDQCERGILKERKGSIYGDKAKCG
ncbi:hypothetical protein [Bacillus swezeyi]|uniref:hypothetical protein n=1 Tax=Bacillus swezeyi TaxID=1925020 RepID=UPI0027DCAB6C|nr:hypothetical protein [Bacillus swezeyi]